MNCFVFVNFYVTLKDDCFFFVRFLFIHFFLNLSFDFCITVANKTSNYSTLVNYTPDYGALDQPQANHFATLLQLVLGYSIIVLNITSTLVLARSSNMMCSVRLPAINMAISDTLIGINLCIPDIVRIYGPLCLIKRYSLRSLYQVTTLLITLLNTDRFLSLRFPFSYSKLASRRNILFGCVFCWFFGFTSSIEEYDCQWKDLNDRKSFQWTSVFFLMIIMINLIEYCYVVHFAINTTVGKINLKCIRKVSMYTGCFILSTIPYMITQLIHTVSANPSHLILDLKKLFGRLTFVTSISNPIMYTILFTECRLQLVILLCFWNTKLLNVYKRKAKERMCTYSLQSISNSIKLYRI